MFYDVGYNWETRGHMTDYVHLAWIFALCNILLFFFDSLIFRFVILFLIYYSVLLYSVGLCFICAGKRNTQSRKVRGKWKSLRIWVSVCGGADRTWLCPKTQRAIYIGRILRGHMHDPSKGEGFSNAITFKLCN